MNQRLFYTSLMICACCAAGLGYAFAATGFMWTTPLVVSGAALVASGGLLGVAAFHHHRRQLSEQEKYFQAAVSKTQDEQKRLSKLPRDKYTYRADHENDFGSSNVQYPGVHCPTHITQQKNKVNRSVLLKRKNHVRGL